MKNRFHLPVFVCVVACLAGWTLYAQGQKQSPVRQAWDYKILIYVSASPNVAMIQAELYDDGKKLPAPERGILSTLKEAGNEGWDLVTVISHPIGDHWEFRYYLKRPK